MEFYDLDITLNKDDIIYMHEELLKEKELSFGLLDDETGRTLLSSDDPDIIIIIKNEKNIYLKRIYG